jgi:hypothetical protein
MPLPELALAGAGSLAKMFTGFIQNRKGNKILKNLQRPDYEIPDEFNQNIGLAKDIKNMGGMSREAYSNAMRGIGRNTVAGLGALRGRGGAVAGISAVTQTANDSVADLSARDAEMQRDNFRTGTQLQMNAINSLATQKLAKQNWDKFLPFQEKRAEGQALVGAGMQNAMGGLTELSSLGMNDMMWNNSAGLNDIGAMFKGNPFSRGGTIGQIPRSVAAINFTPRSTRSMSPIVK